MSTLCKGHGGTGNSDNNTASTVSLGNGIGNGSTYTHDCTTGDYEISSATSDFGTIENDGFVVDARIDCCWHEPKENEVLSPKYDPYFKEMGKRLGLDWKLCAALAKTESDWNASAKNPNSQAGGLWQLMESTWNSHKPKNTKVVFENFNDSNVREQTEAAIICLKNALKHFVNPKSFSDRVALALSGYNIGCGFLDKTSRTWGERKYIKRKKKGPPKPENLRFASKIFYIYKKLSDPNNSTKIDSLKITDKKLRGDET